MRSWENYVAAKIARVAADISRVAADISRVAANISRVVVDKAVEEAKSCWPKNFFSLFFTFFKFFGIFKGENTLFSKSANKWSSFRKKLLYFFPLLVGGGAPDPKGEISPFFLFLRIERLKIK